MEYIQVTFTIHKEGRYYVSKCEELGTASFGETEQEALDNIQDATVLYLNTLEELGECEATLRRRGVSLHSGRSASRMMACPPDTSVYASTIPLDQVLA